MIAAPNSLSRDQSTWLAGGCRKQISLSLVRLCLALSLVALPCSAALADVVGGQLKANGFLARIAPFLPDDSVDLASNLNAREIVSRRVARPRLGHFPDIPPGRLPTGDELAEWEENFAEASIGGIVVLDHGLPDTSLDSEEVALELWLETANRGRIFISFFSEEENLAGQVASAARRAGFAASVFAGPGQDGEAGRFYATAGQRLAIDSRSARRFRSDVTEFEYLGKRLRRNAESLFREDDSRGGFSLSKREPELFLKETLGDEFNQSTVREIIVPGGVALGETADVGLALNEMVFADGELKLKDQNGKFWRLPPKRLADARALFDYSQRSHGLQSDAIVDIDADARVKLSEALRDTDVGWEIMHADTQPFEFVRNLNVSKSVIVDVDVIWRPADESYLSFGTEYEIRFLSADSMRIAQTRAALVYAYDSGSQVSVYEDRWGRMSSRLDENLDYAGLGNSTKKVADYAGWIALFRHTFEHDIPFLKGRYDFLKSDKAGRRTPSRYSP